MEEIKYYTVSEYKQNGIKNDLITVVPLNLILFDLGMKKKVDEICGDRAKLQKIKILKRESLSLNKYDNVLSDFQNKKPMDPVIVQKYKETKFYEVINGRHRVVCSLYQGFTEIPINIKIC
jgi:hypothetical protein